VLPWSMPHPVGESECDTLRPLGFHLGGQHLTELPVQSPW
jgi:hypothetical protein